MMMECFAANRLPQESPRKAVWFYAGGLLLSSFFATQASAQAINNGSSPTAQAQTSPPNDSKPRPPERWTVGPTSPPDSSGSDPQLPSGQPALGFPFHHPPLYRPPYHCPPYYHRPQPPLIYPPVVVNQWGGFPYNGVFYSYGTVSYPSYPPYIGGYPGWSGYPGWAIPYTTQFYSQLPPGPLAGMPGGAWQPNRAQPLPGAPAMPRPADVRDPLAKLEALTPEQEILRRVSVLKPSDEAGRIRSDDLIADGDREFATQAFRRAAGTYRKAIAKAPDYPVGHLRAGHAYVATGDFNLALTYFCMGFELARTVARPGFSLADLYQGDDQAKQHHQQVLADAIQRQPEDGGLLFLLGVTKHYDGQPLQAQELFRKAAELDGAQKRYAKMFLP